MPHHWYNMARERQEAAERVVYETEALRAEIDGLKRQLAQKDEQIASLLFELRKSEIGPPKQRSVAPKRRSRRIK